MSHVLGQFNRAEESLLQDVLREVLSGLDHIQRQGLDRAGNAINAVNLAPVVDGDPA